MKALRVASLCALIGLSSVHCWAEPTGGHYTTYLYSTPFMLQYEVSDGATSAMVTQHLTQAIMRRAEAAGLLIENLPSGGQAVTVSYAGQGYETWRHTSPEITYFIRIVVPGQNLTPQRIPKVGKDQPTPGEFRDPRFTRLPISRDSGEVQKVLDFVKADYSKLTPTDGNWIILPAITRQCDGLFGDGEGLTTVAYSSGGYASGLRVVRQLVKERLDVLNRAALAKDAALAFDYCPNYTGHPGSYTEHDQVSIVIPGSLSQAKNRIKTLDEQISTYSL